MALNDSEIALPQCYNMSTENMTIFFQHFHCSYIPINLTTCLPMESQDVQNSIRSLCLTADTTFAIFFWMSLVTGVLGNTLAIITLVTLPMTTATFYVCLLAVSDLLAVLVRTPLQLIKDHRMIVESTQALNLTILCFDYFASYSNWLLVLICFERFLTIRMPLKKRTCFTMRRAQMVAFGMGLALLLTYCLATWRLGYTQARIFTLRNVLYALLPLCLILVTIALIWCHLWRVHIDREATFSNSQGSRSRPESVSSCTCSQNNNLISGNNGAGNASSSTVNLTQVLVNSQTQSSVTRKGKNTLQDIARLENSLTVMMLVAAIVFFILTIPHCAMWFIYIHSIERWNSPLASAQFYLLDRLSLVLTFVNHSINFFLYFLSAKKFRTQLYKLFRPGAWVRALFERQSRSSQAPANQTSTQQVTLPLDPIANGEYVSLRLLSGSSSSNGTIRLKSSGRVQFTLDQSYYD